MQFTDQDLRAAVSAGALEAERLNPLLDFLNGRTADSPVAPAPHFDLAHLLWYAGALIVMGAMGLFSTLAFSHMGGQALTATALVYAVVFTAAGHYLWHAKNLRVPGGLLIAIAVSMAPLAVYGIQDALGLWGHFGRPGTVRDFYVWIKGSWIWMEVAAIVAAVIALRFYPFPFIVVILAFALWFMSMDLDALDLRPSRVSTGTSAASCRSGSASRCSSSPGSSIARRGGDFAFWLHLFGLIAFWGGLSATTSGSELAKALYCADQRRPALVSVFLGRRVYAVFGALGIAALPRPSRRTRCSATRCCSRSRCR